MQGPGIKKGLEDGGRSEVLPQTNKGRGPHRRGEEQATPTLPTPESRNSSRDATAR